MPELPEVETVRRGLDKLIVGKTIADVSFDWPKSFPNSTPSVNQFMLNSTIKKLRRRAKVLLIDLDTMYTIVVHLKMTGQMVYNGGSRFAAGHPNVSFIGKLPDKSTRVVITFKDQAKLFFNDQRKFGWMRLIPTPEVENIDFFKRVGPEPLSKDLKPADFLIRIRKKKNSTIKAAILDQSTIAGIGNIYADESLWAARIHPETRVKDLSDAKLKLLLSEARRILQMAIDLGGSTDKNYVNAKGEKGSYLTFAKVFRREGQPCERCQQEIKKIRVAARGTHLCTFCQRKPRGKSK